MAEQEGSAGDAGPPKGLPALKAHVLANKVDVALWAIRLLTVLCTFGYVLPLFNNPVSAFYKALLGNAAVWPLRLYQRSRALARSIARARVFKFLIHEDSVHYLFYSLMFMNVAPNLLILTPIFLFALLHAASYSLIFLDTLGQNSMWMAKLLISVVEFQYGNILRAAALAEIVLFPFVAVMALSGNWGLLKPFMYYYFVKWRYASRRNPYIRNTFRELREAAEKTAARPGLPGPLKSAIASSIQLVCRLAPSTEPKRQTDNKRGGKRRRARYVPSHRALRSNLGVMWSLYQHMLICPCRPRRRGRVYNVNISKPAPPHRHELVSGDDKPPPPADELELYTLKPALDGVSLSKQPPVQKGNEPSGWCSVM